MKTITMTESDLHAIIENACNSAVVSALSKVRTVGKEKETGKKQTGKKQGGKKSSVPEVWEVPEKQYNAEHDGVELVFSGKPAEALRNAMKARSFRYNGTSAWYRKNDGTAWTDADAIIAECKQLVAEHNGTASAPAPAPAPVAAPAPAPAPAPVKQDGALTIGSSFVDKRVFTIKDAPDEDHVKVVGDDGKVRTCVLRKDEKGQSYIVVNNRPAFLA